MSKRGWHQLREDEKEDILSLVESGEEVEVVARRFGTTVGVVKQTCDLKRVGRFLRGGSATHS